MKNYSLVECRGSRVERKPDAAPLFPHSQPSTLNSQRGFTLIELLVVISIIGVLAAFSIPVAGAVKKKAILNRASAELAQIGTALDRYKATYGFYPPGNANTGNPESARTNQLCYELAGTTFGNNTYTNLDGSLTITISTLTTTFGVGGFVNCTKGSGEEAAKAKTFLTELKPNQTKTITVNGELVTLLVTSVDGPLPNYQPVGMADANPWRYLYPGKNNPNSYDLWVQIVIKPGQTNLVCNWSGKVQVNTTDP